MDPQQDSIVAVLSAIPKTATAAMLWVWFAVLAAWGGTASYITRIKKNKRAFSVMELIGEWTVSSFVGIVTALLCSRAGLDFYSTAAASGIAGHMGARATGLLENWALNRSALHLKSSEEKET